MLFTCEVLEKHLASYRAAQAPYLWKSQRFTEFAIFLYH